MAWTLCTSAEAVTKAGANANAAIVVSATELAKFSDEVEGTINMKTRKDWVADYANVTTNFKGALADLASDLIANKIINYDMSGYIRADAQTMLNVNKDNADTIMKDLRDKKFQEVMD